MLEINVFRHKLLNVVLDNKRTVCVCNPDVFYGIMSSIIVAT
jgi:hypothetical protein